MWREILKYKKAPDHLCDLRLVVDRSHIMRKIHRFPLRVLSKTANVNIERCVTKQIKMGNPQILENLENLVSTQHLHWKTNTFRSLRNK